MLAKRTPSVGVFTMQAGQVGTFQGIKQAANIVICLSFLIPDHNKLSARIVLHKRAHMLPQ